MKTVSVREAELHLSDLLEQVEQGAEVAIARNGRPVAKLVALPGVGDATSERASAIAEWRRQSLSLAGDPAESEALAWVEAAGDAKDWS